MRKHVLKRDSKIPLKENTNGIISLVPNGMCSCVTSRLSITVLKAAALANANFILLSIIWPDVDDLTSMTYVHPAHIQQCGKSTNQPLIALCSQCRP